MRSESGCLVGLLRFRSAATAFAVPLEDAGSLGRSSSDGRRGQLFAHDRPIYVYLSLIKRIMRMRGIYLCVNFERSIFSQFTVLQNYQFSKEPKKGLYNHRRKLSQQCVCVYAAIGWQLPRWRLYGKKAERRSSREEMSAATAAAPLPQPPRVVPAAMGVSHHHNPGPPSPSKEVRRALARSPSVLFHVETEMLRLLRRVCVTVSSMLWVLLRIASWCARTAEFVRCACAFLETRVLLPSKRCQQTRSLHSSCQTGASFLPRSPPYLYVCRRIDGCSVGVCQRLVQRGKAHALRVLFLHSGLISPTLDAVSVSTRALVTLTRRFVFVSRFLGSQRRVRGSDGGPYLPPSPLLYSHVSPRRVVCVQISKGESFQLVRTHWSIQYPLGLECIVNTTRSLRAVENVHLHFLLSPLNR